MSYWKNWNMQKHVVPRFSRSRGIWSNQRCLSYHFSGRRWRRCCKCNGKCHQGSKNSAEEVTYINAHGTSTHHNDLFETRAIKKLVWGNMPIRMKINSTKSMIGHLLGAAGAVEVIACVKQMENNYVHTTAGYQVKDEECDLDYVAGSGVGMEIPYALTNSLGFGGHNASLLLKKWND
mgnify:CR=1 FL=1